MGIGNESGDGSVAGDLGLGFDAVTVGQLNGCGVGLGEV
jgi:hypothetical protein